MDQRFRLQERGGRALAEVWGFPVQLEGDPGLCQRIKGYFGAPVVVLGPSLDPETGERGTRVVTLRPGAPGWLAGCLRRAAEELGLRLTEVPLSAN
ncbi:MAG TPA: hypothetical protein VNH38_05925 [Candidatus Dormibacteraeota bacterium]|nr:hypothetical protein [Candidatus Dormibacteraeota bacterium]